MAGFEPSRFSLQSKVAKKYGYELTEKGVARGYFLADKFMAEQNVTYPIRSQSELEKENFFAKYEKLVLSGDGYDVDIEISGKIFKELQKTPYSMQLYSDVISVLKELRQIGTMKNKNNGLKLYQNGEINKFPKFKRDEIARYFE